jgi:stage II sporulation protein D
MRSLQNFFSLPTRRAAIISLAVLASVSCAEPTTVDAGESDEAGRIAPPALIVDPEVAAAAWYDGDHATAAEIYRRLVAEHPENQDYRLSLVVLLREAGKIEEALRYSDELTGASAVEHEMNLALAGVDADLDADGDFDVDADTAAPLKPTTDPDRHSSATSRYHFWRGIRSVTGGAYSRATHHFTRALEVAEEGHFPYAHYALGRLAAGRGDFAAAREAYRSALQQDRNLTEVFLALAQAHWELGDYRAAWDQLERARIALPWNERIPELLAEWEDQRPALTADRETRDAERRAAATPPRVAVATDQYQDGEVLRVGLVENLDSVYLKTGGPFVLSAGGEAVYESTAATGPEVLQVSSDGRVITMTREDGDRLYSGTESVRVGYRDRTYTTTVFDMTYGHGQFSSGREDRSYRGKIEILPRDDVFTVINRLSVEEYLYPRRPGSAGDRRALVHALSAQPLRRARIRSAQLGNLRLLSRRHQ